MDLKMAFCDVQKWALISYSSFYILLESDFLWNLKMAFCDVKKWALLSPSSPMILLEYDFLLRNENGL
jgi:drug/metabolite transporter (DMT)-like permease